MKCMQKEAEIDDEMCAALLRENESLIIDFWWDNLSGAKEENAIKRAFYTMHEDDQIAAVKEAKRVYGEVLR